MKQKEPEWYQDYKKVGHNDRYGKLVHERIQGGGMSGGKERKGKESDQSEMMEDEED